MKKKAFVLACLYLLTLLPACAQESSLITDDDRAEIYAAVISYVYEVDNTFGGDKRFSVIYLPRYTDDSVGDPASGEADSELLPESLQKAIVAGLEGLPAEFIWVDDRDEVPMNVGSVAGDGAIITVGNIHLQGDGSVQVAASIYFANLGAGGATYIVEETDGDWQVTGDTGVRWIS